jgi:hypothetical protein
MHLPFPAGGPAADEPEQFALRTGDETCRSSSGNSAFSSSRKASCQNSRPRDRRNRKPVMVRCRLGAECTCVGLAMSTSQTSSPPPCRWKRRDLYSSSPSPDCTQNRCAPGFSNARAGPPVRPRGACRWKTDATTAAARPAKGPRRSGCRLIGRAWSRQRFNKPQGRLSTPQATRRFPV